MDALISVNEAARRLGRISKWTVHAWLSQGRLQRTKVGSRTMIRESELQKVIEDGGKSNVPRRSMVELGRISMRSKTPKDLGEVESFANRYRLRPRISEDCTKIIPGRSGQIYEYSSDLLGVLVMPDPPRWRYWGCVRTTPLEAGFNLVQDGDGEGAATFDPNHPIQAEAAIRAAGVKRKRQLSPDQRDQRTAFIRPAQESHLATEESPDGP
jgi:excisionase family DNA binding protein